MLLAKVHLYDVKKSEICLSPQINAVAYRIITTRHHSNSPAHSKGFL